MSPIPLARVTDVSVRFFLTNVVAGDTGLCGGREEIPAEDLLRPRIGQTPFAPVQPDWL